MCQPAARHGPSRHVEDVLAKTPIETTPEDTHRHGHLAPRVSLQALVHARGAQGRGSRALLRALHRRAKPLIEAGDALGQLVYIEFCAAYVRAADRGTGTLSRFAVERRAWPEFRAILRWEEVKSAEARERGAVLRRLQKGERYGRHLFIPREMLVLAIDVAEEELDLTDPYNPVDGESPELVDDAGRNDGHRAPAEYIIDLPRMPVPRRRSVAARCPRRAGHKNGDRKPSLILWMNQDGVTGGALCPVCREDRRVGSEGNLRNRTWRVQYLPNQRALLRAPRNRMKPPKSLLDGLPSDGTARGVDGSKDALLLDNWQGDEDCELVGASALDSKAGPVGGFVMKDSNRVCQVGLVPSLAYVVAKLKTSTSAGSWDTHPHFLVNDDDVIQDAVLLRTIGTMSHRHCPLRIMMWSDKCSLTTSASRRASEISWFATESFEMGKEADSRNSRDLPPNTSEADASMWLPTDILSVSAMRPSGWREVKTTSGDGASVPTGWEPSAQQWVFFDLDDVDGLGGVDGDGDALEVDAYGRDELKSSVATRAATAMIRVVRRSVELSGVCMVLRSGPCGLHIWAELREVRENPRGWFANAATRDWYARIGARLLDAARKAGASGGSVDMSSCAAGRFARRPGWRIRSDSGAPFRSHIITVATSRVRSRGPRY